jgi:hypothetical protein
MSDRMRTFQEETLRLVRQNQGSASPAQMRALLEVWGTGSAVVPEPAPGTAGENAPAASEPAAPAVTPDEWYAQVVEGQPYDASRSRAVRQVVEAITASESPRESEIEDVECTADGCLILLRSPSLAAQQAIAGKLAASSELGGSKVFSYDESQGSTTVYLVDAERVVADGKPPERP